MTLAKWKKLPEIVQGLLRDPDMRLSRGSGVPSGWGEMPNQGHLEVDIELLGLLPSRTDWITEGPVLSGSPGGSANKASSSDDRIRKPCVRLMLWLQVDGWVRSWCLWMSDLWGRDLLALLRTYTKHCRSEQSKVIEASVVTASPVLL